MPSVAEILLAQGERSASARRRLGELQAGMYRDIGNIASGAVQDYAQHQADAPRREAEALQLEAAREAAAARKTEARADSVVKGVLPLSLVKDANGVDTYDRSILTRELTAAGLGDRLPDLFRELDASDTAAFNLKKAREEYASHGLKSLARTADLGGGTPAAVKLAAEKGVANGFFSREEADQVLGYVGDDPKKAREVLDKLSGKETPAVTSVDPNNDIIDPRTGALIRAGKPEDPKPDTRSLQLQANDALKNGNPNEYQRIMRVIKDTEAAGRAPRQAPQPSYSWATDPATGEPVFATDQEIRSRGYKPKTSASEATDMQKFKQAGPILSAVAELSERINTLQGVAATASGAAERQKAKINLNDDVAEYDALVMGFTPLVARALGHTGVLTEQDVVSVRKLFPAPGDSKTLRDRKIARVNDIIGKLQGGSAPQSQAAPTPASLPPAVSSALKGQKDGRYTLSDGSVWVVQGGQIRKGS